MLILILNNYLIFDPNSISVLSWICTLFPICELALITQSFPITAPGIIVTLRYITVSLPILTFSYINVLFLSTNETTIYFVLFVPYTQNTKLFG